MRTYTKIVFFVFLQFTLFIFHIYIIKAQLVSDFKVNDDTTAYSQLVGKAGIDSSGNFVIVWQDQRKSTTDSTNVNINCQRYSPQAIAIGENFLINERPNLSVTPDIKVNPDGSFLVCWKEFFLRPIISVKIYNKFGIPTSPTITVYDSGNAVYSPLVDSYSNGNFIIAWENYFPAFGESIFFQRFNSSGNKISSNQNVSDSGMNSRKSNPGIKVRNDGSFIICWQDNRIEPSTYDIFMQMYDSSGSKIGNNVRVNEVTGESQEYPKITSDSSGNFVIAWDDFRFFPNVLSVCQFYNRLGQKIGNNFLF